MLEAVYFLIAGRSFRTSHSVDLIGKGEGGFQVEAYFTKHGVEQKLKALFHPDSRQLIYNSTPCPGWANLLGLLCGVVSYPDDDDLIKDGPQARRHFLDVQIAQADPLYVHHLGRYKKAMKQRNLLLRNKELSTLDAWEAELARSGSYIALQRSRAVAELARRAPDMYNELSGGRQQMGLAYVSGVKELAGHTQETLESHYVYLYEKNRKREMDLGSTLIGPHRDDLILSLDGRLAADFASEGQQKSCVAALKLAEWGQLADRIGEKPLMMVDDIAGSLDAARRAALLRQLSGLGQTFVTSVEDMALFLEEGGSSVNRLHIEAGSIA